MVFVKGLDRVNVFSTKKRNLCLFWLLCSDVNSTDSIRLKLVHVISIDMAKEVAKIYGSMLENIKINSLYPKPLDQ